MDTKYPESVSRFLKQRDRRKVRREEGIAISRHRTQPITFSEIQEVDEENIKEEDEAKANEVFSSSGSLNLRLQSSKSAHDMSVNAKLEQFLLFNYQRPEKKRTKKSLNKLSLASMTKPQGTSQTPQTSPIPASPPEGSSSGHLDPSSGSGDLTEQLLRHLNTPRTSI
ncbi:hypothetical protein WDU94_012063 [Cyamophila willieti]